MVYLWSTRAPRRWRENKLSVLDWIWYIALPYLAYALTLVAGIGVLHDGAQALPVVAATMIFMLVIGIRNAWDLAVWMPMQEKNPDRQAGPR
jgi:cation transporter-like permease